MIDLAAIRQAAGLTSYLAALGVDAKLVVEVGEQTVTYDLTQGREPR
jgi:hypothetical protein